MSGAPEPSTPGLPEIGEVLVQKYRIERCIGRGGMGAVFQARHQMLDQLVAIKLLLPEVAAVESAVTRFLNEARSAARIRNEHVAKVLDVDNLPNGGAYMVLEYLEGADLAALLSSHGPLPVPEVTSYLLQALEALSQAHALGIVHRDFKPANLFLAQRPDGTTTIKVLDFGISKAAGPVSGLTATNAMLGSPSFMSPEQVRSSKNVDQRSDLWSAGVCLFQLLTCQLPFKGENCGEVFAAILETRPPAASSLNPEVPPELDQVIARCLQHRESRYATALELAEALAPFAPEAERSAVDRIRRILAGGVAARIATQSAGFAVGTPHPATVPTVGSPKQYRSRQSCAPDAADATRLPVDEHPRSTGPDEVPTERTDARRSISLALGEDAEEETEPAAALTSRRPRRGNGKLVVGVIMLIAALGAGGYFVYVSVTSPSGEPGPIAVPPPPLPVEIPETGKPETAKPATPEPANPEAQQIEIPKIGEPTAAAPAPEGADASRSPEPSPADPEQRPGETYPAGP